MAHGFRFTPDLLARSLSQSARDKRVILLNVDSREDGASAVRLDLDVIFSPVVLRDDGGRARYYVAGRRAEIHLRIQEGEIRKCTSATTLDVTYELETGKRSPIEGSLGPEAELEAKGQKLGVSVGSVSVGTGKSSSSKAQVKVTERELDVEQYRDSVRWFFDPVREGSVVREFPFGNLALYAVCEWVAQQAGWIRVQAEDVKLFGENKRAVMDVKGVRMLFELKRRGLVSPDLFGTEFRFTELRG